MHAAPASPTTPTAAQAAGVGGECHDGGARWRRKCFFPASICQAFRPLVPLLLCARRLVGRGTAAWTR